MNKSLKLPNGKLGSIWKIPFLLKKVHFQKRRYKYEMNKRVKRPNTISTNIPASFGFAQVPKYE